MARTKKKADTKLGVNLHETELESYSGGADGGLSRMLVKCPVPGCNFECGGFPQMNEHMRSVHPERC